MPDASPTPSDDVMSPGTRRMLIALIASTIMGAFAQGMMNIALPSVAKAYHIELDVANWIVVFYNVIAATSICVAPALMRRIGLKRLMVVSAICLVAGSAVGFLAFEFPVLLVARMVQAVATGIAFPTVSATIAVIVPKRHQGSIFAANSGLIGLGTATGPLATGFLITHFGLRVAFITPVVLGLGVLALCIAFLHDVEAREQVPIDAVSVVLAFLGLAALMLGLSTAARVPVPSIVAMLAGAAILAAFCRRQIKGRHVLLHLEPLRYGAFSMGVGLVMLAMMANISVALLLPLYYEGVRGATPFGAGALLFGPLVAYAIGSILVGRLFDAHPRFPITSVGFGLILVGFVSLFLLAQRHSLWGVFGASFLCYVGVGCIISPAKTHALAALPKELDADGSSLNSTFVQVAYCVGSAIFVSVVSADVARLTAEHATRPDAYAFGFDHAILISIVLCAISLACAIGYQIHNVRADGGRVRAESHRAR